MGNVETMQGLYTAFGTGDLPAVLDLLAPDLEWTEAEGFPYAGTYKGPQEVVDNVFVRLATEWDPFRVEPNEFLDAGDTVVSLGWYSGVYRETGREFRARFGHVWRLRDGKVVGFEQLVDSAKVAEALAP